jgi:signal transduction histidine kinase
MGQLVSSIAHEIRNPLTTVMEFVQLLQKEGNHPLYFEKTFNEIRKMEDIIQEFLAFAAPQTAQMEKADIMFLMQQVLKLFHSQSMMQNIEMIQEYSLDLSPIYCDENQIKQAFAHILQNAVEAMPNGGMIKVQVTQNGADFIKISFIDQGIGISVEQIKKIGEPYYITKEKGTGLGMMMSFKIVHEHGGVIEIKSEVNKGTIVNVILPIITGR